MKKMQNWTLRVSWLAVAGLMVVACQDDAVKPLSRTEQAQLTARANAQAVLITQEALDVTADALVSKGVAGGRIATGDGEHDDECKPSIQLTLNIDRTNPDSLIYSGSIIITYGDGSSCDSTSMRTGTLKDEFRLAISLRNKRSFTSMETITFEGYRKDSIQHDGSITVTAGSAKPLTVHGQDMKITYADGTSSSWSGTLTFRFETITPGGEGERSLKVSGSISGTTRDGATFTGSIVEPVVFKPGCHGKRKKIPVSGVIDLTSDGVPSTVDFGDGTCDKVYTVTTAGETTEHTFS